MAKIKVESVSTPEDAPYTIADNLLQKAWQKILSSRVPWTDYEREFIEKNKDIKRHNDMTVPQWNFMQDLIQKVNSFVE